jgi:hypothetical protein
MPVLPAGLIDMGLTASGPHLLGLEQTVAAGRAFVAQATDSLEPLLERYMASVAADGDLLHEAAWHESPSFLDSQWQPAPRLTEGRSRFASGATQHRLVVSGGEGIGKQLARTDVFDARRQRWSNGPPLSSRRVNVMGATLPDGTFHIMGGEIHNSHSDLHERMRPGYGWEARSPLPEARSDGAATATRDGLLLVFGGLAAHDVTGRVDAYSPADDEWETRAPMPTPRRGCAITAASDGLVYVFGGMLNNMSGVITAQADAYEPATDTWHPLPEMPTSRAWCSAVTAPDGRIWVIGGHRPAEGTSDGVEIFDPGLATWQPGPTLPRARSSHGSFCAPTGDIYVVGGDGVGIGPLATVSVLRA